MMRGLVVMAMVAAAVAGVGLSCGPKEQAVVEQTREQTIKAFGAVSYARDDGRGGQDRITIDQAGKIEFKGRLMGQASGQLSEFQMMQLAHLCEGWEKLQPKYGGDQNANVVAITFGQKTVTAAEGAKDLPEQFVLVRQKIETFAREVPAPKRQ
jgi:hypothetical protein